MKNTIWYSLGMTAYLGCQWLLSFLVVRLSGYEDAGALSLAMSISNIFYVLAAFGMRNYQVGDVNGRFSDSTYVTSRIITTAGAFLLTAGFVLANGYGWELSAVILLYCLYRSTEAAADVLHGIDQKKNRLDAVGISNAIRAAAFLLVFVLLLWLGAPIYAANAAMFLVTALAVAWYDLPITRRLSSFSLRWNAGELKQLLLGCIPFLAGALLSTVIGTVPRYFLERLLGTEMLGYFASVATPTLIIQVGASYLYAPLVPKFGVLREQRDGKRTFLSLTLKVCACIACIAAIALPVGAFLGEPVLALVFGDAIRPYVHLLNPAIICTILTAFIWFFTMLLTVLHDGTAVVISNAAALAVCALSAVPLITRFSLQGANYCNALGLAVCLAIQLVRFFRAIRSGWTDAAVIDNP